MVWNTVHDEMLCKKILVVDPFTGTKKGTLERGTQWEEVAENLNKIHQVYFKVDKWAVRDRYNLLSKELRNKLEREEKESGIETDMKKVEMALEELRTSLCKNQTSWEMKIFNPPSNFACSQALQGMHKNALFKDHSTLVAMVTTVACSRPGPYFHTKTSSEMFISISQAQYNITNWHFYHTQ